MEGQMSIIVSLKQKVLEFLSDVGLLLEPLSPPDQLARGKQIKRKVFNCLCGRGHTIYFELL